MKRKIIALLLATMLLITCVTAMADGEKPTANNQTYPLTDEKVTLTFWYPNAVSQGELADFNDSEFFKWYEEKTNVHIEFIVPAAGTETTAFQLLFANDTMPDMVYWNPNGMPYRDGEDAVIDDGYFLNVKDYLDDMPNYKAWLDYNPEYARQASTDSGNMVGAFTFHDPINGVAYQSDWGLAIRKDWLDQVGMEVPTTYDELHDVLVAFKDQLNKPGALYLPIKGTDEQSGGLLSSGYNVFPGFYQEGGTVKYGPIEEGYKEYLDMMAQWYAEGLVDQDFASRTTTYAMFQDNDRMLNDYVGVCISPCTRLGDTYLSRGATNPDFYLVGMPCLKKTADQVTHFRYWDQLLDMYAISVNAESENVELALRWIDGFYAQDVALNANYGLTEGESYYLDEEGNRHSSYDFRYNNPNGLSSATVLVKYWTKNPPLRIEYQQWDQFDDNKKAAMAIWNQESSLCDGILPQRMTMTASESAEYSTLYADISTTVDEFTVKYIMGQETDYDGFKSKLESMGIQRCIEIKQAAYDRYLAR